MDKHLKKERGPWRPYVSLEQIYAFDPARPETSTGSPFVDRLLTLFADPEVSLGADFSGYFELDSRHVTGYLVVATGYKLVELRRLWTRRKVEEMRAANPRVTQAEMARALGYRDHSSMWRFLNADELARQRKERREVMRERRRLAAMEWRQG